MKRKRIPGVAQIIWKGARDQVRRRRWKLLFRLGCWIALISLLLFSCLGCLLFGVLVGRAGAAIGSHPALEPPPAMANFTTHSPFPTNNYQLTTTNYPLTYGGVT